MVSLLHDNKWLVSDFVATHELDLLPLRNSGIWI